MKLLMIIVCFLLKPFSPILYTPSFNINFKINGRSRYSNCLQVKFEFSFLSKTMLWKLKKMKWSNYFVFPEQILILEPPSNQLNYRYLNPFCILIEYLYEQFQNRIIGYFFVSFFQDQLKESYFTLFKDLNHLR